MGDAEIIPIGTRGRPGRGTGRAPSAAARALAKPKKPAEKSPVAGPVVSSGGSSGQAESAAVPPEQVPAAEPAVVVQAPAYTQDRGPLKGIPLGDWQAALDVAAREVFGEDWEPQLAGFLAFLRRRVTGEYVVDEFGFDPELTQRFFVSMLRPIAQKWFRIEVRGLENIPAEGGALVVCNHSGTLPVDGLMTMVMLHDHAGRSLRPLGAAPLTDMPFTPGKILRALGKV